jgi:hypothetical protein
MIFLTDEQCEKWLNGREKPDVLEDTPGERLMLYKEQCSRVYYIARWLAMSITNMQQSLLWMTAWGLWDSSENWHLYDRLRKTYGDDRMLWEAPGHLFMDYEREDLATFLVIAMLNGWEGHLLTEVDFGSVFLNRDGILEFYTSDKAMLSEIRKHLMSSSE